MKIGKLFLFGFIGWFVPFAVSCFMFSKDGGLLIDVFLFKTIMILIGNITGLYLMVLYFKKIKENILKNSIFLSIIWLIVFWLLDFVILIPMSGMSYGKYFIEIGLRYLLVPFTSMAIGLSIQYDRAK